MGISKIMGNACNHKPNFKPCLNEYTEQVQLIFGGNQLHAAKDFVGRA